MKLFGFLAAFATAQDFSVLSSAAEDLDKIITSTTGNVKEIISKFADFDFQRPVECDSEEMSVAEGVACVQKGFSQIFEFGSETIAATAEKFVADGTFDRIVERADQMKQNLRDAGFDIYEYDPDEPYVYTPPEDLKKYDFSGEEVKETMDNVNKIIKEATASFGKKDEL